MTKLWPRVLEVWSYDITGDNLREHYNSDYLFTKSEVRQIVRYIESVRKHNKRRSWIEVRCNYCNAFIRESKLRRHTCQEKQSEQRRVKASESLPIISSRDTAEEIYRRTGDRRFLDDIEAKAMVTA